MLDSSPVILVSLKWSGETLFLPTKLMLIIPYYILFIHVDLYEVQLLGPRQKSLTRVQFPGDILTDSLKTHLFTQAPSVFQQLS